LQAVGGRSRTFGHGTAQSTVRRRQTGRLRVRFAVDAGPVRCEGNEGEARGQHRIRAVVRVRCFICCIPQKTGKTIMTIENK